MWTRRQSLERPPVTGATTRLRRTETRGRTRFAAPTLPLPLTTTPALVTLAGDGCRELSKPVRGEPSRRVATARSVAAPPQLATWLPCPTTYGGCRGVSLTRGVNPPGNASRAQERDGPRRGDFSSLLGFGTVARRCRRTPRRRGAISAALAGGALVRSRGSFGPPSPGTCPPTAPLRRSWRRRRHAPRLPGSLPSQRRFRRRPRP